MHERVIACASSWRRVPILYTRVTVLHSMRNIGAGKSRGPWVQEVRRELGYVGGGYSLNGPGVFIQGLLVCDEAGQPVQQLTLPPDVIERINSFAAERKISLVAYTTDDRIVCARTDEHTDKIIPFNEPVPEALGVDGMAGLAQPGQPGAYKMMLMGREEVLAATRGELEGALAGHASVTKAVEGMLEILPLGASKWTGNPARFLLHSNTHLSPSFLPSSVSLLPYSWLSKLESGIG